MEGALYSGPTSDHEFTPQHDRQILCLDSYGDQLVTGSADHGLREWNLATGKHKRELFTKTAGHTDWVATCAYTADGRVLSGGMDKLLCLWDARAKRCANLTGHNSAISKVMVDQNNIAVSSSYDASLLVWNLKTTECVNGLFKGHRDAVITFEWNNSLIVSGGKDGTVALWDINRTKPIKKASTHKGAVGQIHMFADQVDTNVIITAGRNDGVLAVHDMRTNKLVSQERAHKGAINYLGTTGSSIIVSAAADKSVKMWDVFNGMSSLGEMEATEAVMCGDMHDNIFFAGCGDGNLLAFNMDTQECIWGYGCD